jgi:tRNA pseudouridine13 synthase
VIRIRDVPQSALGQCQSILDVLQRRGVPNYYGPQRFGRRGDTHHLGRAIVHDEPEAFFRAFLGQPQFNENPKVQEARRLYDQGDWSAAQATWPPPFADERHALQTLVQRKNHPQAYRIALGGIPKQMREFYVSAYQSYLFNQVVRARLATLDRLFVGDVATKHDSGGSFIVEDVQAEQPRADRFEISPSGPIFGYRMLQASGEPGRLESQVLADEGLAVEQFKALAGMKLKGERRPLRFPLKDVETGYDDGVVISFSLPAGSYATNVLAEITKAEVASIDE